MFATLPPVLALVIACGLVALLAGIVLMRRLRGGTVDGARPPGRPDSLAPLRRARASLEGVEVGAHDDASRLELLRLELGIVTSQLRQGRDDAARLELLYLEIEVVTRRLARAAAARRRTTTDASPDEERTPPPP